MATISSQPQCVKSTIWGSLFIMWEIWRKALEILYHVYSSSDTTSRMTFSAILIGIWIKNIFEIIKAQRKICHQDFGCRCSSALNSVKIRKNIYRSDVQVILVLPLFRMFTGSLFQTKLLLVSNVLLSGIQSSLGALKSTEEGGSC